MRLTFLKVAVTVAVFLTSMSAYAQFMPVTAKIRRTEVTMQRGKVIQTKISEGVYYRNDDGSYYQQWTKVNGREEPGKTTVAGLFDNKAGILYRLDLTNHLAYQRERAPNPVTPDATMYKGYTSALAKDNVEGIPCVSEPTQVLQSDGKTFVRIGETCESVEYNLELKHDLSVPQPDGKIVHDTYQLYDIHMGTEPDATIFDLQRNFKIYRPDTSQH
ncbi:MAG: hypothetical protein WBD87_02495 [Candidatus Acidiferrales bacterium]